MYEGNLDPEFRKFLFLESGILGFGIQMQLKESGIPPTTGIRKPSSTDKEFGFTSWNPESKTVLYSLKWDVKSRPRSQSS